MMSELPIPRNYWISTINDLPDEVLEYILSLLPPYNDLEQCMKVSTRWKKIVENVVIHSQHNLLKSLTNFDVQWENLTPSGKVQSITKRYSHSACCYDNFMYVFGGCTCSTTFNDLWKLDLSTRQWSRLLTMGTYPTPKACATLVQHENTLLLFGGWTHPPAFPLHQVWRTFDELHLYDINDNRWHSITTPTNPPPPMAGHSATIHKDNMVIFGGLHGQNTTSNDVWCFNLLSHQWTRKNVQGSTLATGLSWPQPRYCQSQIALDEEHLLILGGCGGGPNVVLNDVWLLNMSESVWSWKQVTVRNPQWAPSHLWCHPACRVGNLVVAFSRNPVATAPMLQYSKLSPSGQLRASQAYRSNTPYNSSILERRFLETSSNAMDRDVNVNGRRGSLKYQPMKSQNTTSSETNNIQKASTSGQATSSVSKMDSSVPYPQGGRSVKPTCPIKAPNRTDESVLKRGDSFIENPSLFNRESAVGNESEVRNAPSLSGSENRVINASSSNSRMPDYHTVNNMSNTGMAAFKDTSQSSVSKNRKNNRERQLDAIRRVEERLKNRHSNGTDDSAAPIIQTPKSVSRELSPTAAKQPVDPKMAMFVLDISSVLSEECFVSWLPIKSVARGCPDDMILYSLLPGNGELIMFGGMQQDVPIQQMQTSVAFSETVSNSLHFIKAPRNVI